MAASAIGCNNGTPSVTREAQFPVVAGFEYFIRLDSRAAEPGPAPRGEIHLQGLFSTVRLDRPSPTFDYSAGQPAYLSAIVSEWDGPPQSLSFEADGINIASTAAGELHAFWNVAKTGPRSIRAVWQSADGQVRRSPAVIMQVRPPNDAFYSSPFIQTTPVSIRASNHYASAEEGEPLMPTGASTNSVWWRWTAPADGVLTVNIPDGNGDMSLAACWGNGPWVTDLTQIAANGPDPARPGKLLNHLQMAVGKGAVYAFAVRSMKPSAGSWVPLGDCDLPVYPGREFTFQLDLLPSAAGDLLVSRVGDSLAASFAAVPGRNYVLEGSEDLEEWVDLSSGTTTGLTQLLTVGINRDERARFFRLRLNP